MQENSTVILDNVEYLKKQKFKEIIKTVKKLKKSLHDSEKFEDLLLDNTAGNSTTKFTQNLMAYNKSLQRDCTLLYKIVLEQKKRIQENSQVIYFLNNKLMQLEDKLFEREKAVFNICDKYLLMKERRDLKEKKIMQELKLLENSVDKDAGKKISILELLLIDSVKRSETLENINKELFEKLNKQNIPNSNNKDFVAFSIEGININGTQTIVT